MSMTREQAWDLLTQYNQEEFHLRHAVTVEHVMRWFARELGYGDREEFWGIVGLLHDLDFERWPEEHCKKSQELMRQALTCGTFIMSSNAISADGQLVNLDGNANRVAALCFGPESVLVIAGMNKVMGDLDSAIARARQVAAPANAQRFDIKTPCAVTGSCGDCTSPDCICCQMVITRVCRPAGRIKVILVGQDLGF